MSVVLTEAAAQRVKIMLEKRGHGKGLRLGTRKSGCTGYAYVVDYADDIAPVSYTHLTLPTTRQRCRSRWSPYD